MHMSCSQTDPVKMKCNFVFGHWLYLVIKILHRFKFVRHITFHWKAKGFRFSICGVNWSLVSDQSRNIIRDLKT